MSQHEKISGCCHIVLEYRGTIKQSLTQKQIKHWHTKSRFIQHLWDQSGAGYCSFLCVRTLYPMCILLFWQPHGQSNHHICHLISCTLNLSCTFYSIFVTTYVVWYIYNLKNQQDTLTHFAVTVFSGHLHEFTLWLVFLDKLLLFELSESVQGASAGWNSACTVSNRIYAIYSMKFNWNSSLVAWQPAVDPVLSTNLPPGIPIPFSVRNLSGCRLPFQL